MNYTQHLDDKQQFADQIKSDLRDRAFEKLEDMKREMANEFLQQREEEDES